MSSRALLTLAAVIAGMRALAWVLGLDAFVSVLSGTPPPGGLSLAEGAAVGALVVLLHLAAVLVAPVLAIAAGVQRALRR